MSEMDHVRMEMLLKPGIIAVVRTASAQPLPFIAEALWKGGVRAIEITLTTPGAVNAIRQLRERFGADCLVGAGTVVTVEGLRQCLDAGAQFAVSPIGRHELVAPCHAAGCPVMLGAVTPSEAQAVHEAGADFVKLFPADGLGPGYVKALRAPLPHLRIVPTGGVDLTNAAAFMAAGCAALGVGSSLVTPLLVKGEQWLELEKLAAAFVEAVRPRTS